MVSDRQMAQCTQLMPPFLRNLPSGRHLDPVTFSYLEFAWLHC